MRKKDPRTLILRVEAKEAKLATEILLGRPMVGWLLERLVSDWERIVVFLPVAADMLRAQIRALAVGWPIRIETVNVSEKYGFWAEVGRRRDTWPERVVIGDLLDWTLPYQARELGKFTADLVLGVQQEKPSVDHGSARVKDRYVSAVINVHVRDGLYLTGTVRTSKVFWEKWSAEIDNEKAWRGWARDFAAEQAVKPCLFETDGSWPRLLPGDSSEKRNEKLYQLGKKLLENQPYVLGHGVTLAPTAQVARETWIGDNVQVDNFTVIGKNTYLGKGVRVRSFCEFTDVIVEDGVEIGPYVSMSGMRVTSTTCEHLTKMTV